jgi:hypothetical protein
LGGKPKAKVDRHLAYNMPTSIPVHWKRESWGMCRRQIFLEEKRWE